MKELGGTRRNTDERRHSKAALLAEVGDVPNLEAKVLGLDPAKWPKEDGPLEWAGSAPPNEVIAAIAAGVVKKFCLSKYPRVPVSYEWKRPYASVYIRPPAGPLPPMHGTSTRCCIGIGNISLHPSLQRRGLFTRLVGDLLATPQCEVVVVSNINNHAFARRLELTNVWLPIEKYDPKDDDEPPSFWTHHGIFPL